MELVTNAPSGAADQAVIGAGRNQALQKSLPATATFILSEAGRKASLLAGGDGKALQTLILSVPASRLHLVAVDRQGVARLRLRPRFELDGEQRVVRVDSSPAFDAPPSPEELLRLAARNHELEQAFHAARTAASLTRQEAQRELRERIAQAFLADQAQRAVAHPPPTQRYCVIEAEGRRIVFDVSVDPVLAKPVSIEATRRFRTDQRVRREQNLQERAKQLALHEEKKRFVADWIAKHGTAEQQARQAAGVLPMAEAIEAIADHVFAPASGHLRYVRDGAARLQVLLRANPQYPDIVVAPSDVIAETTVLKTATAAEWATVEKFRTIFPDGTVTLMAQRLQCRAALAAGDYRQAFLGVALRAGPVTVRREFEV
ncbi:MAG: hypothetical protein AB7N65_31080 [Vicinamibacterales bacterium]